MMRVQVIDSFDVKGHAATAFGAIGVVVIYAPYRGDDLPVAGARVLVTKPDGWMRLASIGEVKLVADAPGFFIPGLSKQDVPVGTGLLWGVDLSPALLEGEFTRAG